MSETRSGRRDGATDGTERPATGGLPRVEGLPLLGSTLSIGRDPLGFVESAREHGDVVGYDAFGTDFALVFDPDAVETVLVSRADEFAKGEFETGFGELIAPDGVAFTEGEQWRRQRQLLQSSFTPARIQSYATGMVVEAGALADRWDDGETVNLRRALSHYTLRVLTRTLFDLEFGDDRAATVRQATEAISAYASPEQHAVQSVLPAWLPTPTEREYEAAMADLESLVTDLIARRRGTDAAGEDLLSLLARAEYPDGARLSPAEVRDQLVTFLFAGHETTATALTFACWLLAGDSTVREELERELAAVCDGVDPTVADLEELTYTEAIAREAMRLYPPVVGVYREPQAATTLAGRRIPAGTTLQLSTYGIQRDDRWWDDPAAFRPERWLANEDRTGYMDEGGDGPEGRSIESDPDRPEYAYFPFGGGPRHCLGMRFAMTELKLALATVARRVAFDRVTDALDPSVGVTLDPGPLEVRVRRRNKRKTE
ncbi:cytochrome P450 [Haloterrigena salina JCM 13891]|uniref:Cytochrome P450 n=1 Tax=Haloterrigena salina JCM 13891 TaxID=1227488 RepID=M0CEI8_9EURY|nr:cytochrome P450 [Haloterrigena salina]ELZ21665.1 cytochrome P450 [Haloterrigena salina JCM 13891]